MAHASMYCLLASKHVLSNFKIYYFTEVVAIVWQDDFGFLAKCSVKQKILIPAYV